MSPGRKSSDRCHSPCLAAEGGPMTVPLWARSVAAVIGALLVLTVWANVIKTLIVPRPITHGLAIRVTRTVNRAFRLATTATADYRARDQVRSGQASAIL